MSETLTVRIGISAARELELEVEEANEALAAAGSPVRLALLSEDGTYDVAVTVPDASGPPSYCVARRLRPAELTDLARRPTAPRGLGVARAGQGRPGSGSRPTQKVWRAMKSA